MFAKRVPEVFVFRSGHGRAQFGPLPGVNSTKCATRAWPKQGDNEFLNKGPGLPVKSELTHTLSWGGIITAEHLLKAVSKCYECR